MAKVLDRCPATGHCAARWCRPLALKLDVIRMALKNAMLSPARGVHRSQPAVPGEYYIFARAAFQNEVLVNSSWAFIR